jgi:hypothetical protein
MKNKIAIIGKYHGPTNSCDPRVSLTLPHWGNKRVFLPWDCTLPFTIDQVEAWAKRNNIVIESYAEIKDAYVFIVDFFQAHQVKEAFGLSK